MKHFNRKLPLELASLLIVALVLTAGGLFWRLSRGPMQVDFLLPTVEGKFNRQTGLHLTARHLSLAIEGWQSPIVVALSDAEIAYDDGTPLATISSFSALLARRNLLSGRVHPIAVEIGKPIVYIGQTLVPKALDLSPQPRLQDILGQLIHPTPDSPLADWDHATISGGALQAGGQPVLTGIDAKLERTPVGLKGDATAAGGMIAALEVNRGQKGSFTVHIPALPLSTLAEMPSLSSLAHDNVPVAVTLTATLNDAVIVDGQLDADIGQGQIIAAPLPTPLKIIDGKIELVYQADPERVELRTCEVKLDGPGLAATGNAVVKNGVVALDGTVTVSSLKVDDLANYWPPEIAPGGRKWITANLSEGTIQSATVHMAGSAPSAQPTAMTISDAGGTMRVDGTKVHYFGQLPDVKQAAATIDYDRDAMTIHLTDGHAGDVAVKGGTVILDDFAQDIQKIAIDLDLGGPVSSALDIIDHPPLGYAKKLQIKPSAVGGTADTHLHMAFPLLAAVSVDQLGVTVQSALHDVSIPGAVAHRDVNALNGTLNVDMNGMEVAGQGQIGDIPVTVDYKQSFVTGGGATVTFNGTVDNRQRGELGLDFPDRLKGPVGVSGLYTAKGDTANVDMTLDLTQALFAIDEIGYVKPAAEKGSAKFTLALQDGEIAAIDPLTVEAPAFLTSGSASFSDGKLTGLTLDRLHADETDMHVSVTPLPSGGSRIEVAGTEFDARRFLHKRREKEPETQPEPNATTLEIAVDLAKVKTSDSQGISEVKGQLDLLGRKWRSANFTANAKGKPVFLTYLPDSADPAGSYTLHAGAQDAGAAFTGFALTDAIDGGVLAIDGTKAALTEAAPNPPLAATLTLTDFHLVKAPIFARLLNLLSLSGFESAVTKSDIKFKSLTGKFEVDNQQLRISDGRLTGAALGLTIAGTADRDAGTLDLYGTAVPAYGANRLLNSIPLLGPLLTGGEGQGIFAATYSITGPFENPNVSVNPLSVLAPGVLRDFLFTPADPDMDK